MSYVKDLAEAVKKRERKQLAVIGMVILGLAAAGGYAGYNAYAQKKEEQFLNNVKLKQIKVDVQTIKHNKGNDIYTTDYQKDAQSQIDALKKKKNYTETKPLVLENPYGTNTTSLYYYAKTKRESYIVCTVEAPGTKAEVYKRTLDNQKKNKYETVHEYEIAALVPNANNKITMEFYNKDGRAVAKEFFYVKTKEDTLMPATTKVTNGSSKKKMSNGLFAIFGYDKDTDVPDRANVYLFDNNGVGRGRMPLNDYRTDRFQFDDGQIIYSYDDNKFAFVNRLGSVTKTIDIGNYELHHDFRYNKKHNAIVCLVNDLSKEDDTIEDVVTSTDVKTGKTKVIIDFENYLKEMKINAFRPKKNTYGGKGMDWLHLNSFDFVDDNSAVFSSREQSTIIKMDDIFGKPKLNYLIHSGSVYGGTKYTKYLLKKKGSFLGQAGQHTITVEHDSSLKDGQYYLYMFNNNYGTSRTIKTFDWKMYPGVELKFKKGEASMYYKYLVDEKKKNYKLVQSFDIPYSSIVSSVQQLDGNIPFSSGMSKLFGEYDSDGKLIKNFTYNPLQYSYRIMKYNFKDYLYR